MRARKSPATVDDAVSDADLVRAARAGDTPARRALFLRHAPTVNRLALVLLGRDQDVDDVVQDAFVEALSSLHRLREPDAFSAWLRRVVVQTAWASVRKRRLLERLGLRRSEPFAVESFLAPSATPEVVAELRSIFRTVERMPASLRVALLLRRVEGLQLEEIATLTGDSLATVKRRLTKAEEILKREVEPWEPS